jgi:hypothetical protein
MHFKISHLFDVFMAVYCEWFGGNPISLLEVIGDAAES